MSEETDLELIDLWANVCDDKIRSFCHNYDQKCLVQENPESNLTRNWNRICRVILRCCDLNLLPRDIAIRTSSNQSTTSATVTTNSNTVSYSFPVLPNVSNPMVIITEIKSPAFPMEFIILTPILAILGIVHWAFV